MKQVTTRNMLKREIVRKLEDYVLAHKDDIERGVWSMPEFAEVATKALGSKITDHNVKAAANVMGLMFTNQIRRRESTGIQELRSDLALLFRQVKSLCDMLDYDPSTLFEETLSKYND